LLGKATFYLKLQSSCSVL